MRRPYGAGKSSVGEVVVLQERFGGSNGVVCDESRIQRLPRRCSCLYTDDEEEDLRILAR